MADDKDKGNSLVCINFDFKDFIIIIKFGFPFFN